MLSTTMADDDAKGTSAWHKVPTWDGSPATFRAFKREMNWWIASLDPDSCRKYNVAARWTLRQYGVVRARCEEYEPDDVAAELQITGTDPHTGETVVISEGDLFSGLRKLLSSLEESFGRTELDKKGELRAMFYQQIKRNPGEQVTVFCSRYRTLFGELKREGINLPNEELGWMLKERLGLDPLRRQLLETALGTRESYDHVEAEALRLFRDLHVQDSLHKKFERPSPLSRFLHSNSSSSGSHPSSLTRPSTMSSAGSSFGGRSQRYAPSSASTYRSSSSMRKPGTPFGGRQALVAEAPVEEVEAVEEEEELVPDHPEPAGGDMSLEEVLQTEAEILATELQQMEEDGVDPALFDDLEQGVEKAAESLVTMREARNRIADIRKDRGYEKTPHTNQKKLTGNQVMAKKSNSVCWDCGGTGHWAGDDGCPKPGQQLAKPKAGSKKPVTPSRHVKVTEALNTEHEILAENTVENAVLTVGHISFQEALLSSSQEAKLPSLAVDKKFMGALDSACNRTCDGHVWLQHYLQALKSAPTHIQALVCVVPEDELFRFGNGSTQRSNQRYRLPVMVGATLVLVWISVVNVSSLGLLLGRDFLDSVGAVLSFAKKKLRADVLDGGLISLKQLAAGHFALPLLLHHWPMPGPLRWRRIGQDGIVEVQSSLKSWMKQKFQFTGFGNEVLKGQKPHEHLVTEGGASAARHAAAQVIMLSSQLDNSSSTPPSSSPTSRSITSHGSHAKAPESSASFQALRASSDRAKPVARPWRALVALATAAAAICPTALSRRSHSGEVEVAGRIYDTFPSPPNRHVEKALGNGAFNNSNLRDAAAAETIGTSSILSGRSHGGGHAGGSDPSWPSRSLEPSASDRDGSRSQSLNRSSRKDGCRERADRPQRWFTNIERRFGEAGSALEHPDTRQDHGHGAQGKDPARARHHQGRRGQSSSRDFGNSNSEGNRSRPTSSASEGSQRVNKHDNNDRFRSSRAASTTRSQIPQYAARVDDANFALATSNSGSPNSLPDGRKQLGLRRTARRRDECLGPASWMDGRRDPPVECRSLGRRNAEQLKNQRHDAGFSGNEFKIHSQVKPGLSQMISQAWEKHRRDSLAISMSTKEVNELLYDQWEDDMQQCLNETFLGSVAIDFGGIFVSEVYTTTERIKAEAEKKGLRAGTSMSLHTGWDFRRALDRRRARKLIAEEKPYFLMLAFPCSAWSLLLNLNPPKNLENLRKEALELLRFALLLAKDQIRAGRHVILENPQSSRAWHLPDLLKFLEEFEMLTVDVDQCRFNLRGPAGGLHKKATRFATESKEVIDELFGMKCSGDHTHEHVIGGKKITEPAGHYPHQLVAALLKGMEKQFQKDFGKPKKPAEVLAVDGEEHEEFDDTMAPEPFNAEIGDSDSELEETMEQTEETIPTAIRQAVMKLHQNTGHRSGKRLARALAVSGAPAVAVKAGRTLKCDVCSELKGPKTKRPAALPRPRDVSDQVHIDLFEAFDCQEHRFYKVHMVDFMSRFQMAAVLPDKSSASVENFVKTRWLPIFGPPRTLVADQGREFTSWSFEELCSQYSIYLYHTAVQAPWQNGVCERAGGVLKVILNATIRANSVNGAEEMEQALQEAVTAYNNDVNEEGVTPAQAALGRQPRMIGDVLGNFGQRLAEHSLIDSRPGLIDSRPGLARQVAMRETARLAMCRLHFSRGLRKAFLARPRALPNETPLEPGDIAYFFRNTKYNPKSAPAKRKLLLRRWHGPALVIACEGHANVFLSFKGQITKCAREHVRAASSLEQVSADVWHDAIAEAIEAAKHEVALRPVVDDGHAASRTPSTPMPSALSHSPTTPLPSAPSLNRSSAVHQDEVPLQAQELIAAVTSPAVLTANDPASTLPSRRTSLLSQPSGGPAPGTPLPDLVTQASQVSRPFQTVLARAQEADEEAGLRKRAAEVDVDQLRDMPAEPAQEAGSSEPAVTEVMQAEVERLEMLAFAEQHPLKQIQALAKLDRLDPEGAKVQDHGTWRGYWPLPSRTEWMAMRSLGLQWPCGNQDVANETMAVLTARKEKIWSQLSPSEKEEFKKAADTGWSVWVENEAVDILSEDEANAVLNHLRLKGEMHKVLIPMYVYTDKNDGLRTSMNQLPLRSLGGAWFSRCHCLCHSQRCSYSVENQSTFAFYHSSLFSVDALECRRQISISEGRRIWSRRARTLHWPNPNQIFR